jgi:galactose-1-phosphate uridylyltransferase
MLQSCTSYQSRTGRSLFDDIPAAERADSARIVLEGSHWTAPREQFALHLEPFTIRRAPAKLKYLAGSASGMGAFANDITPEAAGKRLRQPPETAAQRLREAS